MALALAGCASVLFPGLEGPGDAGPASRDGATNPLPDAASDDGALPSGFDLAASPDLAGAPMQLTDLAEDIAATWDVGESQTDEIEPCNPVQRGRVMLIADAGKVKVGQQAVRVLYGPDGSKFFQALHPKARNADWNLAKYTGLALWLDGALPQGYGGWIPAGPTVVLCSANGGSRRLDPAANHVPQSGTGYIELKLPVAGGTGWKSTDAKNFDPAHVRWIEIHVDPERGTGKGNCTLWLDGVRFY